MAPQRKDGFDLTRPIGTRPGRRDVIVGRGGSTNHHLGSKEWRALVDERKLEYLLAGSQREKRAIVEECIQEHKARGGRYVGEWEGQLYEATNKKAYEKTIQRLRERNPKARQVHRVRNGLMRDDNDSNLGPVEILTMEDIKEMCRHLLGPSDQLTMANDFDVPMLADDWDKCPSSDREYASSDDELPSFLTSFADLDFDVPILADDSDKCASSDREYPSSDDECHSSDAELPSFLPSFADLDVFPPFHSIDCMFD